MRRVKKIKNLFFRVTKKLAIEYVNKGLVEPEGYKIKVRTDLEEGSYFRKKLEKNKKFEILKMSEKESFKDLVESDVLYFVNRRYPFNFGPKPCTKKIKK